MEETAIAPLESAKDPITDDLAPIRVTIGEVEYELAFTVGSIRRLRAKGIDILRLTGDRAMEVLETEKFDVLLSEGLTPRIEAKAVSAWIENSEIYLLMRMFADVRKAIGRSTTDPNAPKVKDPNPQSPSTGSTSSPPAE